MAIPCAVTLGKKLTDDRFTRQRRKRNWSYKFFPRRSYDNLYLSTFFYQSPDNVTSLIGSNTSGYT